MADYEIQKDFDKVVNWLSGVKEQAYQSVDNAYKEIKANAAKEHRPPATIVEPKAAKTVAPNADGTIGVVAGYGLLLLLILFFLYRDKDSWFRRRVSMGLSRVRRRWQSRSESLTDV